MVKSGLLACIFLMLQELFPPSRSFVFLLVVPHPVGSDGQERPAGSHLPHMQWLFCTQSLLNVSTSLFRISSDGQERPTGSHLPHGARNGMSTFNQLLLCFSSSGHNMLNHTVVEGGNRARSLLSPPAVRQMAV
ncbi:hypothetical protein B0H16DRAFT_1795514 [Mycena metata]|uniref:Secreted protein n=1 Tax=Mycena metata TaxID=1033252 RepID=A0AAD7HFP4_9AGAR|nr:hypothetical protein B0H16DRAFT_1795514 [Mycena metata]